MYITVGSSINHTEVDNQPRAGLDWVNQVLVINASTKALPSEHKRERGVSLGQKLYQPNPSGGQWPSESGPKPTLVAFLAF